MQPFDNFQFKPLAPYAPGQIAFNNNAEMSQLLTLFAGGVLPGIVGQNNFLPSMLPSQNIMDQFAAKQYQAQTRMSDLAMAGAGNADVAKRLLGLRTMFTRTQASEMNRAQAMQMAAIINNPMLKGVAGMMMGPENVEAMLHGRRGDVASLSQAVNRIGYFRADPNGQKRMGADALANFSQGMYAHLYDPGANFEQLAAGANRGDQAHIDQLRSIARTQEAVIDNETVATRIAAQLDPSRIATLYDKYVAGGEQDTAAQARALTKLDSAIQETGVLEHGQISIDRLVKAAREHQLGATHGFMAGQLGQLTEHMFQRGMLPESIGAMSAAERVKLLQNEGPDEATLGRLAREYGHRDLMKKNKAYASATEAEREEILNNEVAKSGGYIEQMRSTMAEINKPDEHRKSMQDLEKLTGFDALAGNVDAKRSADTVKKYSGAVAAVRDIFGDNGNPNAPMPALLAALEQLSGGASAQMDPKKLEAALRQMQTTAREAGVGFEQLAAMSAQMQAMGDMLGLSKSQTMNNQVSAMAMMKTMRDTGAFSNPVFGAMGQGEAAQAVAVAMQQGDASDNAKTMAALAGIYNTAPDVFKDTDFARAMEAYNNPESNGDFMTATGRQNIYELVGRGGPQALLQHFKQAGGSMSQFQTAFRDPNSQQFMQSGGGMQSQRYELIRDAANLALMSPINDSFRNAAPNTGLATYGSEQVAAMSSEAVAALILDSSGKSHDKQIEHIQANLASTLKTQYMQKMGLDENAATALAAEATTAMIGNDTDGQQKLRVKDLMATQSAFVNARYNLTPAQANLIYGNDRLRKSQKEAAINAVVAQRKAAIGMGYAGHPFARLADYLLEMGEKGMSVTAAGMSGALAGVFSNDVMVGRATEGMTAGLDALHAGMQPLMVTHKYIEELGKNKEYAQLRQLAGAHHTATIVDDAAFKDAYTKSMNDALADPDKVSELYKRLGISGDPTRTDTAQKRDAILANESFQAEHRDAVLQKFGPHAMTHSQLLEQAKRQSLSHARLSNTDEENARLTDYQTIRSSFLDRRQESLQAAAASVLRLSGKEDTEQDGTLRSAQIATLIGMSSPDEKKDAEHQKALADALKDATPEARAMAEASRRAGGLSAMGFDTQQITRAEQTINTATIQASTINISPSAVNEPAGQALPQTNSGGQQPAGTAAAANAAGTAAASSAAATQTTPQTQAPPAALQVDDDKKLAISGTLTFDGTLEAAVIRAVDNRMNDVPGNGASIK